MASVDELIIEALSKWGEDVVKDLRQSINDSVKYESGQESSLAGTVNYKVLNNKGNITFQLSMADYWKYVERGRKKGAKGVPTDKIGKAWQNSHNINASKIIEEINIKSAQKRGLKLKSKKVNYDKAAKTLAFLIQRSIKKKGIEPRPFMSKVINEDRINELKQLLAPLLAKQFILDIKSEWQ